MGEVIHGDYRRWANSDILDSTTNYEAFKGLYSSHNDKNYFEIAHSLSRQFGEYGLYKGMTLFNFVDNHDVDRIASQLRDPAHLYPLHILLFTIPGVPSIYYGSEWGIDGRKTNGSDDNLRPYATPALLPTLARHADLQPAIKRLIDVRKNHPALRYGSFNQIHVGSQEFVFERRCENERAFVMVNSSAQHKSLTFNVSGNERRFRDVLNHGHTFESAYGKVSADIPGHWGRVLIAE